MCSKIINQNTYVAFGSTDCKWWFIKNLTGRIDSSDDALKEMKETKGMVNVWVIFICSVAAKKLSCE